VEFVALIKDIHITPDITISKSHYYCDYIELIALVNNDILSNSDIFDIFDSDGRIKIKKDLNDKILGTHASKIEDKWKNIISNWFKILNLRKELFILSYPFLIKNDSIKLKSNLSIQEKVYIFLLLNSNQKYLNKNKNLLTSDFEELSLIALKNYLPTKALSYRFGKSMLNYDRYEGKLINKIDLLAEDLKYKTQYDKDDFDENDNGDGGLDLVSWIPFGNDENQNNMQVILCQCATGKEWFKKQYETEKFTSNFINFRTTVNKVVFIPYDGRQENRRFTEQKEILNDVWLFDRIRILNLLKKNNHKEILSLKSFDVVVDKMIKYQEDII
jgi:hypothetical protein